MHFAAHCRPRSCGRQRAAKSTHKNRDMIELNELKKESQQRIE